MFCLEWKRRSCWTWVPWIATDFTTPYTCLTECNKLMFRQLVPRPVQVLIPGDCYTWAARDYYFLSHSNSTKWCCVITWPRLTALFLKKFADCENCRDTKSFAWPCWAIRRRFFPFSLVLSMITGSCDTRLWKGKFGALTSKLFGSTSFTSLGYPWLLLVTLGYPCEKVEKWRRMAKWYHEKLVFIITSSPKKKNTNPMFPTKKFPCILSLLFHFTHNIQVKQYRRWACTLWFCATHNTTNTVRSTRKPKQLILPRVRTSRYVKSFFFRSSLLWNTLPANLQNITCHRKFKKNIEAHWSAHKYSTKFCLLPWSLSWWTQNYAKLHTPSTTCNSFLCVLLFAVHVFFYSSSSSLLLLIFL